MKKKIIFVDDEPEILQGLKRALRIYRKQWEMVFFDSGPAALAFLQDNSYDAIVTDMSMPGMSGAELLDIVSKQHPSLIRIILSGQSYEASIIKTATTTHQFLTKPCDVDRLTATLNRALGLSELLGDGDAKKIISGLNQLPSIPRTYLAMINVLQSPNASMDDINDILVTDPSMMAKILQLVNSAFFGLGRNISDPRDATKLIGLDSLKALVLSIGIFCQFDEQQTNPCFNIDDLLTHSLKVGKLAQSIALAQGMEKPVVDECFMAGVLHDIGLLILAQNFDGYERTRILMEQQNIDQIEAENSIFGTNHALVGAYLLGLWGLPTSVVEAVARHHHPFTESGQIEFSPLTAVHVADAIAHTAPGNSSKTVGYLHTVTINENCLSRLGLVGSLDDWVQLLPGGNEK